MAKTIALEFTDAQWELIKEHYTILDDRNEGVECTEETFAHAVQRYIGIKVTSIIANKAKEANKDSFNV